MTAFAIADALQTAPSSRAEPRCEAATVQFALVSDREDFDRLEADWTALFDRCAGSGQLFQSYAWAWHWTRHFLDADTVSLAVVTARRDGRLVMVWPLVRTRRKGLTRLIWLGEPVSQYGDVLVEAGPEALPLLRHAWAYIRNNIPADIVNLRKTRADAAVAPLLAEIGALPVCRETAPFARLEGEGGFDGYAGRRWSSKTRKNRRRQMRRLMDMGPVGIERNVSGMRAETLARETIRQKQGWLAGRGLLSPALADASYEAFFAAIASGKDHPAGCRVSALTVAGRPAALEIAFAYRDRLALHIISYDPTFDRGGAGAALMEAGIRQAFEDGVTCFDLLAPGGGYKDEWADGAVDVTDWAVAMSLKGKVYARGYLAIVRPNVKAAANGMPRGLRRLVAALLRRPA